MTEEQNVWKIARHYSRDCIPKTAWKVKRGDLVIMGGMTKRAAAELAAAHNRCLFLQERAARSRRRAWGERLEVFVYLVKSAMQDEAEALLIESAVQATMRHTA